MKAVIEKETDPKTGEIISRVDIPDFFKEKIEKKIAEHNNNTNHFMMMSQQIADLQIKWQEKRKDLDRTSKGVTDQMQFCCKKMKLNDKEPWIYNLQRKCFELRNPPELKPMTASEIQDGQAKAEGESLGQEQAGVT